MMQRMEGGEGMESTKDMSIAVSSFENLCTSLLFDV